MLRTCVLPWKRSWEDQLALAKFAYNSSYQTTIKMAPYEALYGRHCVSPLCWETPGEKTLVGLDFIQQTIEKIQGIRQSLLTS
jgi:hypothetical protein